MKNPFDESVQRYWDQRHHLFSKFDEGVRIDRQALFSVKPEQEALNIADRIHATVVVDAFAGVGGSSIAFARRGKRVIAIEMDTERIEMARHNARLYGVEGRIEFIQGDARQVLPRVAQGAVYFDPPWGGPDYYKRDAFGADDFDPSLTEMIGLVRGLPGVTEIVCSVPARFRFSDLGADYADARLYASPRPDSTSTHTQVLFLTVFIETPRPSEPRDAEG